MKNLIHQASKFLFPSKSRKQIALMSILFLQISIFTYAQSAYTPGKIAVLVVGDGTAALGSGATPLFVKEFNLSGASQSGTLRTTLPSTATSGVTSIDRALTQSGSSTSEGVLNLSDNKQFLILAGYNSTTGTATVSSSVATTFPTNTRVVGKIAVSGVPDTKTTLNTSYSGQAIRSGITVDGTAFWTAGANGINYTLTGSIIAPTSLGSTNTRNIGISNNQLYTSSQSGTLRLATIGTGLPTSGTPTITNLSGFLTTTGDPYGYTFIDIDGGGPDVVYIASLNTAPSGLLKYTSLNNGATWTAQGSLTGNIFGVTGFYNPCTNNVDLYLTSNITNAKPNSLYKFSDLSVSKASPANITSNGSALNGVGIATLLATAATNTAFGGVAFTPNTNFSAPSTFALTGGNGCANPGVTIGLSSSTTGINYQLFNGVTGGAIVTGTGSAISFGNITTAGSYTVVATNPLTGCTVNMTGTVVINPTPAGSISSSAATVCSGTPFTLSFTSSIGTGPFDIIVNGTTYTNITSGSVFATLSPSVSTTYTLTSITDKGVTPNCPFTLSQAVNVTVTAQPIWYKDIDNDLYGDGTALTQCTQPTNYYLPSHFTALNGDCNDAVATINPAATEVCGNGIDDDCDLLVDENNSLTFDGVDDNVSLGTTLGNFGSSDFTVEFWIKTSTSTNQALLGKRVGCGSTNFWNFRQIGGKVTMEVYNTSGLSATSTTSINNGAWHHIAGTRTGTSVKLYIDGVQESTTSGAVTALSNTAALLLGVSNCEALYSGSMDELRIWNVARTQAQIQAAKNTDLLAQSGLIAYYKFDQGTANGTNTGITTLTDASGNNNTGTLNTFALTGTNSNWTIGYSSVAWYKDADNDLFTDGATLTQCNQPANYYISSHFTDISLIDCNDNDAAIYPNSSLTINCASNINATLATCGATTTIASPTIHNNCTANGALSFDGTNDYISIPSSGLSTATNFTLEAWVNPSTLPATARIFDFGNDANNFLRLSPNSSSSVPRFQISIGGTSQFISGTSILPLNTWSHIAFTLSGIAGTLYINGVVVSTGTFTFNPSTLGSTVNNYIGRSNIGTDAYLNGKLDELRVWNVSRTQAQIQANMNLKLTGLEPGLVRYYDLNESSGTTAKDNSSNAVNGTLNNFALTGTTSNWVAGQTGIPNYGLINNFNNTNSATGVYPAGTTSIVWTAKTNSQTATCTQTVTLANPTPVVTATGSICVNSTLQATTSLTGGSWSSNNANATVSATGLITGVTAGTSSISYTTTSNGCTSTEITNVTINALPNATVNVSVLSESFDNITTLNASGWVQQNNSSPIGATPNWYQGYALSFSSHSGVSNSYIAVEYNSVSGDNTISNWLIAPPTTLHNGDVINFWTRTTANPTSYPDRLQLRMSINGTSSNVGTLNTDVGDFTNLLLDINPTLSITGYPDSWTKYTAVISGLANSITGRVAFRYFVTNGGPDGANSAYIGIDDFTFSPPVLYCGNQITLTASGGLNYLWSNGATTAATIVNPITTTNYIVTVTDANSCSSVSPTIPVTINPSSIAYSSSSFCKSQTTAQSVTMNAAAGGTFSSSPAGLVITPSTGSILPSVSTAGTYIVSYASPNPACGIVATTTVTITTAPTATFTYNGSPFSNLNAGTITPTFSGTIGGTFSAPAGLTIESTTGIITPSSSTAGSNIVTYTLAASGGCSALTTTTVVTITAGSSLLPTGDGGFENGNTFSSNGWTLLNGATNQWFVGNVSIPIAGSNAAYISNDVAGATHAYTINSASTVYFYRDVIFPAGQPLISLSFQWKNVGESNLDRPLVYTGSTSLLPAVNVPASSSTTFVGATLISATNLVNTAAYTKATITLPSAFAGTTQRIFFAWQNDNAGGSQTPASIDDIQIVSAPYTLPSCPLTFTPANGTTNLLTSQSLSWSGASGNPIPTGYDVYLSTDVTDINSLNPAAKVSTNQSGTTFSPTTLALGTTYYWTVIPKNSAGDATLCTVNSFSTHTSGSVTSTALGGLWSSPLTWVGGFVPLNGDNVTIADGATVVVDQVVNTINSLTVGQGISGQLNWFSLPLAMTLSGNLTIATGGRFLPYTTGGSGITLNIGGNFTNNGYTNLAVSSTILNFNGSQQVGGSLSQTLGGTGVFQANAAGLGVIRSLRFQTNGSSSISTSQNLVVTDFVHAAGSLTTNGKLTIDNTTAQVYGQAFNLQVASATVTTMGSLYATAPILFGATTSTWTPSGIATLNTRYFYGNNVYIAQIAGTFDAVTAPSHTTGIVTNGTASLLWLGTIGTIGNPFASTCIVGTQYFYGNNLYTCIAGTTTDLTVPPTHISSTATSGAATFLYVGTAAKITPNWDAASQTLRSISLTTTGNGYSSTPTITVNANGSGSGALASATYFQQIIGTSSSTTQKSGSASITGAISINNTQGASFGSGVGSISTTNGGVNYTVAPSVGFAGPTMLNLVINNGAGYSSNPTITFNTPGTLVSGTALTTSNFTITVNQGKVVSVYLNTGTSATYSVLPTLAFTGGGFTTTATLAFPANCLPTATATIGSNGQLTNFTISNAGFGYNAAPTVGLSGGTFTTAATTPTSRLGLYSLSYGNFTPSTSDIVNTPGAELPANRKLLSLTMSSGLGVNFTSGLELFGTSPFSLSSGVVNMGSNNLLFTWNGYAGTSSSTNSYVTNGTITLTTRGGGTSGSLLNFPFASTFTAFTGTGSAATGSTVSTLTASIITPSGTVSPSGGFTGVRGYRAQTNTGALYGTNPTVTLNWNATDNLIADNPTLFIANNTANSGTWNVRSASLGSGALTTTGNRSTATSVNGPIAPGVDAYYAWTSTFITPPALNYVVTRTTQNTYQSIAPTTVGGDGTGTLSTASGDETAQTGIAFTGFTYQGSPVTSFSINPNGFISLNNSYNTYTSASSYDNSLSSFGNGQSSISDFNKRNIIAPFYDDLSKVSPVIYYKIVGTKATIEWFNTTFFGLSGPQLYFQVVLDGSDNSITFNYGNMQVYNGSQNIRTSYTCGLSGAFIQGTPQAGQVMQQQFENTTYFTNENANVANWGANGLSISPEPRSSIKFTPGSYVVVSAPSNSPPSNDDFASAVARPVLTDFPDNIAWDNGTNSSNLFTTRNATHSNSPDNGCGGSVTGKDVWFKFIPTSANTTVRIYGSGGFIPRASMYDAAGNPVASTCVVGTQGSIATILASGLVTSGAYYYVRVYHENTGVQATATAIVTNGSVTGLNVTPGSNYSVVASAGFTTPVNLGPRISFTGGGGLGAAAALTTPTATQVLSSLSSSNLSLVGGSGYTSAPTVTIESPDWGVTGEFGIVVLANAVNDECASATTLTNVSNATCVDGQNQRSNVSTGNATPSADATCIGTADDDVWYQFTAVNNFTTVTVNGIGNFNPAVQIFNAGIAPGSCVTKTSIQCLNATSAGGTETSTFATVVGNVYYVRVYDLAAGYGGVGAAFTICVSVPTPACVTTGISPANNSPAICDGIITLSWPSVLYATKYDVYLDNINGTTLVSANQTATTFTTTSLTGGPYFWKIIPKNNFALASACTNFTLNLKATPQPNASSNAPICDGFTLNLFGDNLDGGQTVTNWAWSGPGLASGSTSQNPNLAGATIAAAGTYNLTITNSLGCTATTSTIVVINPNPVLSIVSTAGVSCNGNADGALTISASGGTPTYLYDFDGNTSIDGIYTGLAGGIYSAIVKDDNGCESPNLSITIPEPALLTVSINNTAIPCSGSTLNLTSTPIGGTAPYSYSWTGPNGFTSTIQNPIINSLTLAASGLYNLQVTDAHGCIATSSKTIIIKQGFTAPFITSNGSTTFCLGSSINLDAGTGTYYQNDFAGTFIPSSWSVTHSTNDFGTINTTNVPATISITSSNSGSHLPSSLSYCHGITASGTITFAWNYSTTDNPGFDYPQYSINGGAPILFTGYNLSGANTQSGTVSIAVNAGDNFCLIMATSENLGGAATVTISSANFPLPISNYSWSNGASTQIITATNLGFYSVTVTAPNGCSATSAPITVNPNPSVIMVTATPASVCSGGNSQLNVVTSLPYCTPSTSCTFPDIISNVTFGTINNSTSCDGAATNGFTYFQTFNPTIVAGNTYPFSITTSGDNEGAVAWIDYNQDGVFDNSEMLLNGFLNTNPATYSGNITIPTTALNGETRMRVRCKYFSNPYLVADPSCAFYELGETEDYRITIQSSNNNINYTYDWTANSNFLSATTIQNPIAQNVTSTQNYSVKTTDLNGCFTTSTVTVHADPLVVNTLTLSGTTSCYGIQFVNAAVTGGVTPYVYAWKEDGIAFGGNTASINSTSGTHIYEVTVTDNCGTILTSSTLSATTLPAPIVAVSQTGLLCDVGGTVSLTASGADTYLWSPATGLSSTTGAGVTATVAISTNYSVIGTFNNGCNSLPFSYAVNIYNSPIINSVTANPTTICGGGSSQINTVTSNTDYLLQTIPYAPVVPTGTTTAGPIGDDVVSGAIPIGFTFPFYSNTYSNLYISTNGFVTFNAGSSAGCCSGQNIPNASNPNNLIALDWTDLNTLNGGTIDYFNLSSPNRFVVRFNNVSSYTTGGGTGKASGEIILYETGEIEIHNTSITTLYLAHPQTQGIENADGSLALSVPGRNASFWNVTGDAYKFILVTNYTYNWTANSNFLSATNIQNPIAQNVTSTQTYSVLVTAPSGCTTQSVPVTVNVIPAPIGTISATSICPSGIVNLTFTATSGTGPFDIVVNGITYLNVASGIVFATFTPLVQSTTYTLTSIKDNGVALACVSTVSNAITVAFPVWYADADGDGYGDPLASAYSCTQPLGYISDNTDCNDNFIDGAAIHPGATEICNGIDDNCNLLIDDGLTFTSYYQDSDGDLFGNPNVSTLACTQPANYVTDNADCDDTPITGAAIHPGATEICGNGIDENCNGMLDDVCTTGSTFNFKVFIQGFYDPGTHLMAPVLFNAGEGIDPFECDTITVELYDPLNLTAPFISTTTMLFINGTATMQFPNSVNGNSYYIVVKHRNSIETWSKVAVLFTGNPVTFDFTTP